MIFMFGVKSYINNSTTTHLSMSCLCEYSFCLRYGVKLSAANQSINQSNLVMYVTSYSYLDHHVSPPTDGLKPPFTHTLNWLN